MKYKSFLLPKTYKTFICNIIFIFQTWCIKHLEYSRLLHFFLFSFVAMIPAILGFPAVLILIFPSVGGLIKELIDKYLRNSIFDLFDLLFSCMPGVGLYLIV